jgi:hypothetical protein
MRPHPQPESRPSSSRHAWQPPRVVELPRLIHLTLTTGDSIPGNGGTDGGGSTVIP